MLCGDPGVPIHGPSGASAHLRGLARGLAERGHQVTVAALRHSDHRGRVDSPLGVPSVTTGTRAWPRRLRTFGERQDGRRLARRAAALGTFDLVYERYSLFCDAGVRLARQLGVPHVLEVNAPLSLERGRSSAVERRVLAATDRVVAVSDWLAEWATRQGARCVAHVANGSDLVRAGEVAHPLRLVHHGSQRAWHGTSFLPRLLDVLPDAELWTFGGARVQHPRATPFPALEPVALARELSTCGVGVLPYPRSAPPWFDPLKLHDYRAVGVPTVASLHPAGRAADRRVDTSDLAGWVAAVHAVRGRGVVRRRPWVDVAGEALGAYER